MAKRIGIVLGGFIVLLLLLGQVTLDPEGLSAAELPTEWWWSGALPLLVGSSMPPLVAIASVLITRRLLLSLGLGTFAAAVLAAEGPVDAFGGFFIDYLWYSLYDPFHGAILLFTTTLIGLVNVASQSGGTQGIVKAILKVAKGLRGARLATVFMGFAVFFDDYANTAIVGPTMRPLFDKLKLSREKLAYLLDSTAAPVAGLALISTWVGTEVGYMQDAAQAVGVTTSGYALFFSALGYRFYCIFALVLVFALSYTGRDFGPMLAAERRSLTTGQVMRPGAKPLSGGDDHTITTDAPPRWYNAVAPIGLVLGLIIGTVFLMGGRNGIVGVFSPTVWRDAFIITADLGGGNFLSYLFAWSALVGAWLAIVLPWAQGTMSLLEGFKAWAKGAKSMAVALAVLVFAWAMSSGCSELNTAGYVGVALRGLSGAWVPMVVFIVSGLVAFATGTSWGTMAILIPTAAAVAHHAGGTPVMIIAMAAVLDGSIFGDHVSPISDTTVLSSICAGCDHLDHVRTQVPYALAGCGVAGVFGYGLVAAGGMPGWLGYLLGAAVIIALVRFLGKTPIENMDTAHEAPAEA